MNAANSEIALDAAIEAACDSVAPNWPLDRAIAVNPWWGWTDQPFETVARQLHRLADSRLWMPPDYYRRAFSEGRIEPQQLSQALAERGSEQSPAQLIEALDGLQTVIRALPLLSDTIDADRDPVHEPRWRDTVTFQISQFCAAYFDRDQADWQPASRKGLYTSWREAVIHDHGVVSLMHSHAAIERARDLPAAPRALIAFAVDRLGIDTDDLADFLRVVLLRLNGWAAWCAWLRWQARLTGADDHSIVDLLAVRLAWEWLLDDDDRSGRSPWARWRTAWQHALHQPAHPDWQQVLAVCQRAEEIAFQEPLATMLAQAPSTAQVAPVSVQAVFCIDVRSEVFRRALEQAEPTVETRGFAGFFGLPVSYTPLGTDAARPQLPGLLAPSMTVSDSCGNAEADAAIGDQRRGRLADAAAWRPFERLPGSTFTLVESLGLGYLGKIVSRSLARKKGESPVHRQGLSDRQAARLRPVLQIDGADAGEQRVDLAERVLRAMGLTGTFARLVLLAGHGSESANNPLASGLDCGACCGQTGEVNARALAGLLNDPAVRAGLAERGVWIPATTQFVAALHNTTTDDVELFDTDCIPEALQGDLARLRHALEQAGEIARAERAPKLGLSHLVGRPSALAASIRRRAGDWSQTRPEWGLADNAAFIVAPRSRTRGIDLGGRAFLHDYDWRQDHDGSVLELIMTAPMIVTHWINMQYYASTVDNRRYGSGNKILHNVVGGRIGVFEGNGGDLRIGLARQSLHDGERWMHTPLRLSVFIDAPRAAIDEVIAAHKLVHRLLENQWLYLFRLDRRTVEAWSGGRWQPRGELAGAA